MFFYRFLVVAVTLAGCVAVYRVEQGRVSIGSVYSVENNAVWALIEIGELHQWTVDGAPLQEMRFITGVKDGGRYCRRGTRRRCRNSAPR